MTEDNKAAGTRVFFGIILILIGGLIFLRHLDLLTYDVSSVIFSFPFFAIVIGLIIIFNSRKRIFGFFLLGLGAIFLIPKFYPEVAISGSIILPILIISLGIYIIFRHKGGEGCHRIKSEGIRKDTIDDVAVFGGGAKVITSDNFKGGNITAVFGGSEIDLSGCKLAEGENVIDIITIFGGSEIVVPPDWNVIINVTPIFGGFSNKAKRDPNVMIDKSRSLIIKGLAIFGGGEIKVNKYY